MSDTRNVQLTLEKAQEWYQKGGELKEVALQAFKEEELKDSKPRSWEEYCKQQAEKQSLTGELGYYLNMYGKVKRCAWVSKNCSIINATTLPSRELTEKFRAYMKLMSLHQKWIGDWEPDWTRENHTTKYCIYSLNNEIVVRIMINSVYSLSFPTEEMAEDFKDCFRDLLEKAKGLY